MTPDLVRPSQVPGFAAHSYQVPANPPTLLPGLSAKQLATRSVVMFALAMFVWVGLLAFADASWVVLSSGLGLFALGWFLLKRLGDRLISELSCGYTSFSFASGMFWFRNDGWVSWDFSGVWKLTGAEMIAPTQVAIEPPGLYPSPHREGKLELWSGRSWTKVYRVTTSNF